MLVEPCGSNTRERSASCLEWHVLVLDDELIFRRVIRTFLRRFGCVVAEAATLEAGLCALASRPPDAVLLDKNLPDGNGLSLAPAVRSLSSHARIVVVTGYPSMDSQSEARRLGADDYLVKPVSLNVIFASLLPHLA
jgi:DNA-binding response OmpR family regulator